MQNKFVRTIINLVITLFITISFFTFMQRFDEALDTQIAVVGLFNLLFFLEFLIFNGDEEKFCFIKNAIFLLITIFTIFVTGFMLFSINEPDNIAASVPYWVYYGISFGLPTTFVLVPFFNLLQKNNLIFDDEFFYPFSSVIGYIVGIGCCMGVTALGKFAPFLYRYGGLIVFGLSLVGFIIYFKKEGFPFYKLKSSSNHTQSQLNHAEPTQNISNEESGDCRTHGGLSQLERKVKKICSSYSKNESLGSYWSVYITITPRMGVWGDKIDITINLSCSSRNIDNEYFATLANNEISKLPSLVESIKNNISREIKDSIKSLRENYSGLDGAFSINFTIKQEVH